ncbi:hypothetical protein QTP86_008158 [Hemibagrus guttatus]|nr:hypothetical protein QTP86_008158 [Hemibagrus guttatus]
MSQKPDSLSRVWVIGAPTHDCYPKHIALDPYAPSCGWWAYGKVGLRLFFGLCPTESRRPKTRPPGARLRAPTPGLAPGLCVAEELVAVDVCNLFGSGFWLQQCHGMIIDGGINVDAHWSRKLMAFAQNNETLEKNCTEPGPGRLAVINGTMNSAVYQKILKENVWPSVCDLKLKRTWVLQQDIDPKHTSKSTSEWLKKNKMKTLEWPSQNPDLNPSAVA